VPPDPRPDAAAVLRPGHNCWRIDAAHRVAVLVDGDAYFRALRHAIAAARRSVTIVGWDIDSRMRLVPDGAGDGLPEPLGEFLHAVVARRPGLDAWVLGWDFSMLYALEREWLPVVKLDWRTHRRLRFRLDASHPLGASHHQKVVVVDDAVAFVGGFDLAGSRWDRSAHRTDEPLRVDCAGKAYPPFHDVQAMVDGPAAAALGALARERWRRATGQQPSPHEPVPGARDAAWPPWVVPDLTDVPVALARTEPAFDGRPAVHEVLALHRDAIASARRDLYFENQYLTADAIAAALAERLAAEDGPQVALVSRRSESGWLEEATMGALRGRFHARLRAADGHGRYGLYCPQVPGLGEDCVNVHSKLFVVDDALLSIGSANLANRSMLLDTECAIAIESRGEPRIAAAIAAVRDRLLAEHLALEPATVGATVARRGVVGAIELLRGGGRTLAPLEPVLDERAALLAPQALVDPERPIEPERLVRQLMPEEAGRPTSRRLVMLGGAAAALGLLAIAWRWTPLSQYLDPATLAAILQRLAEGPLTPVAVIGGYVVAGLLVVPVTLLIGATGFVFGPVLGGLYAITGSLASALVTYLIGRRLGRDTVRRLAGRRMNRLSRRIARRGVLAVTLLRLMPVAPFSLVNLIAGASHIRLRDFLLGSAIGMAPGILLTVVFVHHLAEAIRDPRPATVAVLALVVAALVGLSFAIRRVLASPRAAPPHDDGAPRAA
jgi:uncharacterized membrane protein YdjX (TVP38/TMEM64 family)/phosphatidylserine/phosphatidylglycerophosphate/cardiolipin synthase-like enzyme